MQCQASDTEYWLALHGPWTKQNLEVAPYYSYSSADNYTWLASYGQRVLVDLAKVAFAALVT